MKRLKAHRPRLLRLRFQPPRVAGQGFPALDQQATLQPGERLGRGQVFHLRPILALVGVARVQQEFVPVRLVAQEQQSLGIRVEPTDGVDVGKKAEFRQRPVRRTVAGELLEDAVRFVEGDEHGAPGKSAIPPSPKPS